MYRQQLSHEARIIVQGRQQIVRSLAALLHRMAIRLGFKAAR